MHGWRIMLLATVCQLLVSLLPCALWPWLLHSAHVPTKAIVVVCLAIVLTLALWCETLATQGRDDIRLPERGIGLLGAQLSGLMVLLILWCGLTELGCGSGAISWLMMACGGLSAAVGIGLRTLAILSLGKDFRTAHRLDSAAHLKTTGLYAWTRHPSETGLLLFALGCALLLHSGIAAILVAGVLWPLVIVRLRQEESFLRQVCGPAHEQYCRRVPMLIPRLVNRLG
jgi:protein-S-isoprenylcysteine O-methyltransferase Ste14